MTVVITGWRSAIAQEFRALINDEPAVWGKPLQAPLPVYMERYLFCQGLLRPKRRVDQTPDEIAEGYEVNHHSVVAQCNRIMQANPTARICIIGSESGYRGSFDDVYADAKRAMHGYIEEKSIGPSQQLVGVSPGVVADAGMTTRREDIDNLDRRRREHPMGRFLAAREVARMAWTLLYEQPYVTGTIVRMHGGQK